MAGMDDSSPVPELPLSTEIEPVGDVRRTRLRQVAGRLTPSLRFTAVFLISVGLLVAVNVGFVLTAQGQQLENLALRGAELRTEAERLAGQDRLSQVSLVLFAFVLGAIVVVGFLRGRALLGVAVGALMGAAVLAVEILKDVLPRPILVEGPVWILRNSFPSGTAAVAAAIAVGAMLISPDRLRWLVVPLGAAYAAIVGEATQTTGWHRLSDTLGAVLVVIATASAGLVILSRAGRIQRSEHGHVDRRLQNLFTLVGICSIAAGMAVLALAAVFPLLTSPEGGRRAFLQTAFPLLGIGFVITALSLFARVVEPFTVGRLEEPHE